MAIKKKDDKKGKSKDAEENIRPDNLIRLHAERLKTLRKAQEFSQADDIIHAVEYYNKYLNTLGLYYSVEEKKLHPKYFDPKKDVAELLLVSHVYWDLAKAYDRSPNLRHESVRCLDQFAKFTMGYKYQYVNAQMLNNFIKKRKAYNLKAFKQTYDKIRVQAKSCYIATYCYGDQHFYTNTLREFKTHLLNKNFGKIFIKFYYHFSPKLITLSYRYPKVGLFLKKIIFKPFIKVIVKVVIKSKLTNINQK